MKTLQRKIKKGDKFKVSGLEMFEGKTFTADKVSRPKGDNVHSMVFTVENSFPFSFFYPHQIEIIK